MINAGVHVGLFRGAQDLRLQRRRRGGGKLPQGRLQYIMQNEFTHVLQTLRGRHDPGMQAMMYGVRL